MVCRIARHPFVIFPFLLYAATAHRQVGLPDWAVLADAMARPELAVAAWNHPLTNLLGWFAGRLAPGGTLAARLVWVSVLPAALAVICFYGALLASGLPRWLASACGAIYMLSHAVWWHGTITENYAVSLLLLNASLWISARAARAVAAPSDDTLAVLFALAGLSLANHLANAVLTPAACAWLWLRPRPTARPIARSDGSRPWRWCGWWLAGALPFLVLAARDLATRPGAWGQLTGGGFRGRMFSGTPMEFMHRIADLLVLQFPSPFGLVVILGTVACALPTRIWPAGRNVFGSTRARLHGWAIVVPTALFFGTYDAWDRFAFFLPVFTVTALWGSQLLGHGWRLVSKAHPRRLLLRASLILALAASVVWPPWVYGQIRHWARQDGYWARRYGAIERQYGTRYDLVGLLTDPLRHDRGSLERFVDRLLEQAPPGAWIVDDLSTYYQLGHVRRARRVRDDLGLIAVVPEFLADYGLDPQRAAARVRTDGQLVVLVTTNGLCGMVAAQLRAMGYELASLALGEGRSVWILEAPSSAAEGNH